MYIIFYSVPESVWDVVDFGLVVCFFFCQYWDPPGLLFPIQAEYILFLLRLYFFYNLDQEVLVISYSPQSKYLTTLLSPSTDNAFLMGIETSIGGGGIFTIT